MARGNPITTAEKYAIRAMLEDGKTVKQIAQCLKRSETLVRKKIDEELKNTENFINSEKPLMSEEIRKTVLEKLVASGLSEFDAHSSINRIKNKITTVLTTKDVDKIVSWCLTHKSPKDSFVTKTKNGRTGFAIMTESASEIVDELKAKRPNRFDSCIYRQENQ